MEVVFDTLTLGVRPGLVMTPRPRTEQLVARAAALVGGRPARVADVGTGSGAIAVALALRAPRAEVWATDTSAAAVDLARENAERHRVADRVHLREGDLLEGVPGGLDVVVANLPYLPASDAGRPDVAGEPPDAVFSAGDGLDPYRRLAGQAALRLRPGGTLLVQLHGRVLETPASQLLALPARLPRLALELAA